MKLLQRRKENWDNDFVPNILLLPYEIDTGTLCLLQILQTRLVHRALSLSRWAYYQCVDMYGGGHLFCPRSLRVVFVFWIPSNVFKALFGSTPRTLFFSEGVMASPRLSLVRAQRSFLSGVRPSGEQRGPGVRVTAPPGKNPDSSELSGF